MSKPCMIKRVQSITAFILAGGKSSRMGRDKAFLEWEGKTLLMHSLAVARAVTEDVRIVGDAQKFSAFAPVVEDILPEHGPLGGIHAALSQGTADLNLMLAVDLPFVEPAFLTFLISVAQQNRAVVTVPRTGDAWQSLCAIYRREFAATAETALREGKNRLNSVIQEAEIRAISDDELARAGFAPDIFRNLNTPEDLERARKSHL